MMFGGTCTVFPKFIIFPYGVIHDTGAGTAALL